MFPNNTSRGGGGRGGHGRDRGGRRFSTPRGTRSAAGQANQDRRRREATMEFVDRVLRRTGASSSDRAVARAVLGGGIQDQTVFRDTAHDGSENSTNTPTTTSVSSLAASDGSSTSPIFLRDREEWMDFIGPDFLNLPSNIQNRDQVTEHHLDPEELLMIPGVHSELDPSNPNTGGSSFSRDGPDSMEMKT